MTSTIFNPYVDPATVESKIGYYNGSPGETPDSSSPQTKTVGVGVWAAIARGLNDLLPYKLRPIKAKRRRARPRYGWRAELFTLRMTWRSHRAPALVKKIQSIKDTLKIN
jgi:hypothetical protein